ncbi:MAG: DnaA/Hda family protein [Gemmatimonadota bacterium]
MTADLNPRFRFDTFVVGSANRLAVSAAKAVAESPGVAYNPLFIYSGPGLGKTHLLMAIAQAARTINPGLVVEYLTLDDLVESFHAAVAAGQGEAYRRRFTEIDMLLVDDVQFLDRRREMQTELLRVINSMQTANRQIVLTSDRSPSEIEALDERLIQRFAGGLVIDIAAPDYETRVAIVRRHAEERKTGFTPAVLETVAALAITNVRELIGALNRLIAYQAVSDQALDEKQAQVVLGGVAQTGDEPPAPDTDEFGSFLTEISSTVAQQVEAWRTRVAEAVLRWEGEGYRVSRLNALLEQETPPDPDLTLREYAADIERLLALEAEATDIDATLGGTAIFRDPDRLAEAEALLARAREGATPPPAPSPFWQLADFAEGPGNRIAVRAALMAVEHPALKYNPLVLIGPSGTGKTHLLHAIGNGLTRQENTVVACLSTQEFVDDLIAAIDRDRVNWWRSRYRRITAFLLDDIQQLESKERTQEELFWLFNHLMEEGRQMVFTSTVPLVELEGVEQRLISRLEGGLVVHLPPPEREVRATVLDRLLREATGASDPELSAYLAGRNVDSIRTLQGVVQRVINAAETRNEPPSAPLARELLEGTPPRVPRRSGGNRVSGVIALSSGTIRSREKMIWEWPESGERIIEDLR